MAEPDPNEKSSDASSAIALKWIAALMVVGASWVLAAILVPFFLALILAIALTPVSTRLERLGSTRAMSSLACLLAVMLFAGLGLGLVAYEAGTIVRDSDRYIDHFSTLLSRVSQREFRHSANHEESAASLRNEEKSTSREDDSRAPLSGITPPRTHSEWKQTIYRGLAELAKWLATGVGGILGVAGGGVISLAFLFYMLQDRDNWMNRLTTASRALGMKPRFDQIHKVQTEVVAYLGCLAMVACGYFVVVSTVLWLIGVPQPMLWGLLAGMLEVVPYFGPLVASVLPTVVALSLGSWWQPVSVIAMFLSLHLVEGYVITPMIYGKAVKLDPVSILFGAMFFGSLWGPVGLAIATPMMIILRGLVAITPDTPSLDALADVKETKPL